MTTPDIARPTLGRIVDRMGPGELDHVRRAGPGPRFEAHGFRLFGKGVMAVGEALAVALAAPFAVLAVGIPIALFVRLLLAIVDAF